MVSFIKSDNPGLGEIDLARELSTLLAEDKKVLWIISGGSNIAIEATIMRQLDQNKTHNLRINLGDERYGQKGHSDSNEKQLSDKGFTFGNSLFTPILEEKSLAETTEDFAEKLSDLISWADEIIGQFGIGDDGHISGILPSSDAIENQNLTASYRADDFTRITMTVNAIKKLSKAYVFCFGNSKKNALENLMEKNKSISDMPSMVVYSIPNVYVYNDLIGGNI